MQLLMLLVMHCCIRVCYCNNSFYFVDNQLVMHNKASYKYTREDAAQAKKSYEQRYGSKGSKTRKAASSKAHDDSSDDDELDGEAKQGADAKVRTCEVLLCILFGDIRYFITTKQLRDFVLELHG
jgi:hypothetical protein